MSTQNREILLDYDIIEGIVKEICSKVMKFYVFPDVAEKICNFFSDKIKSADYKHINDPVTLQNEITTSLHKISGDLHFYFEYNPRLAKELLQRDYDQDEDEYIDEHELKLGLYDNYHIVKAERLPGNIGYIKINDFQPAEYAGDVIVGALQFLANTYALIFDVRNNGGGYPSMVQLIISYLVSPSSKLLTTFYERRKNKYSETYTLPYVPGKRFLEKPVYVLTSRRTASAAEEFAYNLKMMERAVIIGETTRGAANPIDYFPISDMFVISIPIGKPINPISHENWEGKGVAPNHQVPQVDALKKAHLIALDVILKSESDEEIKELLEFELEYCKAQYEGIKIDKITLNDFQGEYEGAKIVIINDEIIYEQKNVKHPLITRDNKIFFANEAVKLWFEVENQEKVLIIHQRNFPGKLKLYKKS